jgi:hypothetical protein
MPIKPSKNYALVKDGIVQDTGNKRNMGRAMKKAGGRKAGYSVYFTVQEKQIGAKI